MNQNVPAKQPEKEPPVVILLRSMESQIAKALPKHLTADRMCRVALTEIRKNPKLLRCDPYSVLGAIMQFAQLGLEIGGSLGHAYLVPYGAECTPITGYKGQIELALRSTRVKSIVPHLVYPEDTFEEGVDQRGTYVRYSPARLGKARDPATELKLVFAIATMDDGTCVPVVLEKWEVDKIRDGLRYESNTWRDHYGEMAKKTAIRRLSKLIPQSPELIIANSIEDGDRPPHQPFIDLGLIEGSYVPKEQAIGEMEDATPGEHRLPHEKKADEDAKGAQLKLFDQAAKAFAAAGGNVWETIKRDPAKANEWDVAIIKAATDILNSKARAGK